MILGVGVDLVEVGRLERAIARHGEEFLREILTGEEIDRCRRTSRFLPACATVFAAKEALFKALGTGRAGPISWQDVSVRGSRRSVSVSLEGAAAAAARRLGVERVHACLSAGARLAAAVVVLEGRDPRDDCGEGAGA